MVFHFKHPASGSPSALLRRAAFSGLGLPARRKKRSENHSQGHVHGCWASSLPGFRNDHRMSTDPPKCILDSGEEQEPQQSQQPPASGVFQAPCCHYSSAECTRKPFARNGQRNGRFEMQAWKISVSWIISAILPGTLNHHWKNHPHQSRMGQEDVQQVILWNSMLVLI